MNNDGKYKKLIRADDLIKIAKGDAKRAKRIELFRAYHQTLMDIKTVRIESGLTQEKLAEKSGVPIRTISNIENGKRNPTVDTLFKIASAMNKTLEIRFI
jgi:DNA-binding XRE family transcriptional regulator